MIAAKYRRTRRNRLRYRKPRFDNRKRSEGWLAPSLEHKKQLNIRLIERYVSVIPITRATVEVGSFDTMLLQAIQKGESKPEGVDYQKGPRYNLATLREAVFYRDNYTCQVCGRKINDIAFGEFVQILEWAASNCGTEIVKIDRFAPSSKCCSRCGYIYTKLTLKQREWDCPSCGTHHERDVNAAINICRMGLVQMGYPA